MAHKLDKIRCGPQVGMVATSLLPIRGSPTLQSGEQNQKWPTSVVSGYITPAVWGVPNASERATKSEVAHKWAGWLHHPCCLGGPQRYRAGTKSKVAHNWAHQPYCLGFIGRDLIRRGPQLGLVATSPLPCGRSPMLQSGEQNHHWPTSWPGGCITLAVLGVRNALKRKTKSEVVHKRA